jgi:hypothetical protein
MDSSVFSPIGGKGYSLLSVGKVDKLLVTALYEHLTGGRVRGHTMRVFLDDEVFRTAEHFRQAFVESVLTTHIYTVHTYIIYIYMYRHQYKCAGPSDMPQSARSGQSAY